MWCPTPFRREKKFERTDGANWVRKYACDIRGLSGRRSHRTDEARRYRPAGSFRARERVRRKLGFSLGHEPLCSASMRREKTIVPVFAWLRCFCAALALALLPLHAHAADAFYKGKSVTFILNTAVGGGYDTYGRLVASHLGRHLAGEPLIGPQNMPGAGGLRSRNYLYNAA